MISHHEQRKRRKREKRKEEEIKEETLEESEQSAIRKDEICEVLDD